MAEQFNTFMSIIAGVVSSIAFLLLVRRAATQNGEGKKISLTVLRKKVIQYWFFLNLAGGVFVGAAISFHVLFFSPEPSYFLMPLVLAPLGYWATFWVPMIGVLLLALYVVSKNKDIPNDTAS